MEKRLKGILLLLILCLLFVACGKSQDNNSNSVNDIKANVQLENTKKSITEIAENFFAAFENSDYEGMKTLCTKNCIDTYFHDGDVFGMVWAKAVKIGDEIRTLSEIEYSVFVDVEMKPSEVSAFSPDETNTSFYIVIKKKDDGGWLIDKFTTG